MSERLKAIFKLHGTRPKMWPGWIMLAVGILWGMTDWVPWIASGLR